jgi:hypothetical protein
LKSARPVYGSVPAGLEAGVVWVGGGVAAGVAAGVVADGVVGVVVEVVAGFVADGALGVVDGVVFGAAGGMNGFAGDVVVAPGVVTDGCTVDGVGVDGVDGVDGVVVGVGVVEVCGGGTVSPLYWSCAGVSNDVAQAADAPPSANASSSAGSATRTRERRSNPIIT